MVVSKKHASFIIALIIAFVPVTALAHGNNDTEDNPEGKPELVRIRHEAKEKAEEARESSDERKAEILKRVEIRKVQIKQDICERKQDNLKKAIPRLSQGASSVKQALDKIYIRVAEFYETGQLSVDNYDELVDEIEIAKADSGEAIESIYGQTFELDCANQNVGEQLDAFRLSVQSAKEPLKAYKKSLVSLISSMKSSAALNNQSDDSAQHNETEVEGVENE